MRPSAAFDRETFAFACLLGIFLGAGYDLIRALRRGMRLKHIAENVLDLLYTLFFFFCYFVLSVARTGDMRLFTLAGMLAGAAGERFTSGRVILFVFSHIFGAVRRLLGRTLGRVIAKIIQITPLEFVKNKYELRNFQKNGKRS